jgi:hypothetical protein
MTHYVVSIASREHDDGPIQQQCWIVPPSIVAAISALLGPPHVEAIASNEATRAAKDLGGVTILNHLKG